MRRSPRSRRVAVAAIASAALASGSAAPALAGSTVHLLMAGEDSDEPALLLAVGGGLGVTATLTVLWLLQLRPS